MEEIKEVVEITDTVEQPIDKQEIKPKKTRTRIKKDKVLVEDNKVEDVKQEVNQEGKNSFTEETCKIIQSINNEIVIDFHEKCISFKLENNTYKNADMIKVLFSGNIGTKNFKIKLK